MADPNYPEKVIIEAQLEKCRQQWTKTDTEKELEWIKPQSAKRKSWSIHVSDSEAWKPGFSSWSLQ